MRMNKNILSLFVWLLLGLVALPGYSQTTSSSGFFVIIKEKTGCANTLFALTGANSYCLPKEPVIPATEFESVTTIQNDLPKQMRYIDLRLTAAGFKILKSLIAKLPDASLALVIEDRVVGTFESVGRMVDQTIPISGAMDAPEIDWIYNKLKKKKP